MTKIDKLLECVKKKDWVFIQTHDFPDHDAVASAFALQYLLDQEGIRSHIIYEGEIERNSLERMIDELMIDIGHTTKHSLKTESEIIIVDGCKGNRNVTDLVGTEIAVIDHHEVDSPEDVSYIDIRPRIGSTSTLIYSYFIETDMQIPQNIATALLIGIDMDTALLTRGVSDMDVEAYANLYEKADVPLRNSILRNYIQTQDLRFYRLALDRIEVNGAMGFCYFPDGCNQNLLAILGDFFLSVNELNFVVVCAKNDDVINISVRNERDGCNASLIIQEVLEGIGFGGGHKGMAGGVIHNVSLFDEKEIHKNFLKKFREYAGDGES